MRIKALVRAGDFISLKKAEIISRYGRELTPVEELFRCHYANIATVKHFTNTKSAKAPYVYFDGKRKRNITFLTGLKIMQKHTEEGIFELFMEAVNTNNAAKILEIAAAVQFFKNHRYPFHVDSDPDRRWLLFLRERIIGDDEKWTIRQVAEFLAKSKGTKVEASADGFSALRRKCKELNFPLAESRKRSRK